MTEVVEMIVALLLVFMLAMGGFALAHGVISTALEGVGYAATLPLGPGWWILVMVEFGLLLGWYWLVRWRRNLPRVAVGPA